MGTSDAASPKLQRLPVQARVLPDKIYVWKTMNWEVACGRASNFEWLTADGATVASEDDMSEEGLSLGLEVFLGFHTHQAIVEQGRQRIASGGAIPENLERLVVTNVVSHHLLAIKWAAEYHLSPCIVYSKPELSPPLLPMNENFRITLQ
ncbi:hypothetical protein F2Q68_00001120 [Brassica cretica]|uniref:Uncharacterized protein n=1 Tax=Brassica cretica TaxID=69181 RepID=A0A8S9J9S3_BRACR|nr:hypothetical protein F2Q68_00001120 [Brassica cretica]